MYRHFSWIIKRVFQYQLLITFLLIVLKIHYSFCVCVSIIVVLQEGLITAYTRKMVPIKKRASSFPIIVCHPALPSFHLRLLVVSFV